MLIIIIIIIYDRLINDNIEVLMKILIIMTL